VLPAALRHRLGVRTGDELLVTEEADGALRVQSRRAAARTLIGLAGAVDHSVVEELREQRRREVTAEDAERRGSPR
jgi:bifunctional DNA-binding transcriptional regulator/antitoxin component of YhaV-PrlF toxin-antitoxin module